MTNPNKEKDKGTRNSSSTHVIIPENGISASLILGISSSPFVRSNLSAFLLDMGLRVVGPFPSLEEAKQYLESETPNCFVFDAVSNMDEFSEFTSYMKDNHKELPLLIIWNSRAKIHGVNDLKFASLRMPLEPQQLSKKLDKYDLIGLEKTPEHQILKFTNDLFVKIIELATIDMRYKLESMISNAIYEFSSKNSDFSRMSEESLSLILVDPSKINTENFITFLHFTMEDLIMDIDKENNALWAHSLIKDAIESILIDVQIIPPPVSLFAGKFGINTNLFKDSLDTIIPKLNENEKPVFVGFISLTDLGPEVRNLVANDEKIIEGFDDGVASQIITLVGQGSSYHQGLFGPVPIPTANNIIGIIWSKILESDIQDDRMEGKSLSVVVIGLYRDLITHIPDRTRLKQLFTIFDDVVNVKDINQDMLFELERQFLDEL